MSIGTPQADRQPGRAVPMTVDIPDLVVDLAVIVEELRAETQDWPVADTGVELVNKLAEFGWQVVRLPR